MKILNFKGLIFKSFKRPKIILSAPIVSVFLCLILSKLLLSNYYVARAKILVSTDIIGEGGTEQELLLSDRVLNTTVELLKSRDFIKGVVKELNLEGAFGKASAFDRLLPMIRIRPVRGADIIEISVRSKKAELATLIANAMSKVVITLSTKDRFLLEKDIVSWIAGETSGMKKELEDARGRLHEFKESIGATDAETQYNIAVERLSELQQNLNAVRIKRERLESEYADIENSLKSNQELEELPPVASDGDFKQMQSRYNHNKAMIEELLKKYQPSHPEVTELTEELSRLEISLDARAKEIVKDIEADYKAVKIEEEKLQRVVDEENKIVLNLEEKANQHKTFQEDLKEKEAVYNAFLEKVKEGFVGGLRVQQLSLAEQAYLPRKKEGPSTSMVIFIGLLIGLAIAATYNILKDKGRLFIEKTKVLPPQPQEKIKPSPPKGKGMYIERVREEGKKEE